MYMYMCMSKVSGAKCLGKKTNMIDNKSYSGVTVVLLYLGYMHINEKLYYHMFPR